MPDEINLKPKVNGIYIESLKTETLKFRANPLRRWKKKQIKQTDATWFMKTVHEYWYGISEEEYCVWNLQYFLNILIHICVRMFIQTEFCVLMASITRNQMNIFAVKWKSMCKNMKSGENSVSKSLSTHIFNTMQIHSYVNYVFGRL